MGQVVCGCSDPDESNPSVRSQLDILNREDHSNVAIRSPSSGQV